MGSVRMNLNERYTVLYQTFDQAEVDHVMKTLAHDVVSIVANEMSQMKIKDEGEFFVVSLMVKLAERKSVYSMVPLSPVATQTITA